MVDATFRSSDDIAQALEMYSEDFASVLRRFFARWRSNLAREERNADHRRPASESLVGKAGIPNARYPLGRVGRVKRRRRGNY